MGCPYSCFKAPTAGVYVPPNNSNSGNRDFIQKKTKFAQLFGSNKLYVTPSWQQTLSSNARSNDAQNYTQKDKKNDRNNRNSRLKDDIKIVEDEGVMIEKVIDNGEFIDPTSEEEDVCPTCFEEYTPENPKIGTKCCHVYHLSCIYEWKLRSEKCPICGKVLEVESLTFD